MWRVGMKVYFGQMNGEKTLGEIVKVNRVKAKVKTLETRGNGRGSAVGAVWTVPYTLMTPIDEGPTSTPVEKLKYNPDNKIENLIIEAIMLCESRLSSDIISSDEKTVLQRQLIGLTKAFGRKVDVTEMMDWSVSRTCHTG